MKNRFPIPAACFGLLLFSCQVPLENSSESDPTRSDTDSTNVVATREPPFAVNGEYDSVFAYLTDRYDADGDCRVSDARM